MTKDNINHEAVAKFITRNRNLIRADVFDDSVMQQLMESAAIRLLGILFKTSETADIIERRDQGDPESATTSVRTDLIDRRMPEDPGTGMTSTGKDPIVRQDPSGLETEMISMRTRPTDHRDPDNPETWTTAETIEHGEHAGTPSTIGVQWRIR